MTKETKMAVPSAETRAALSEVLCAFEAFKDANDRRLGEIEAKRAADPLLEEKLARIDAALNTAQSRLDRLSLDAGRPGLEAGQAGISEAKAAWDGFMRTGQTHKLAECKSLSVGTPGDGGYVAPAETQAAIDRLLTEASPIRAIAGVRQTTANVFKKPVSLGGAASGWVAESAERPETDSPGLDLLDFPTAELYAMPAATTALLDDALVDIDLWLAEEVRDVFAAQESAAFVNGNGTNKPKGFLAYTKTADASAVWGEIGYVATGVDGDFAASDPADDLIDLIYAPKPGYRANARFVMNRRTVSTVRKFKDSNGDYIWRPSLTEGGQATLLGYPVTEAEDMPDIGSDSFAIAFGDFGKGYLIVDRQGVQVLRDPYSAKPYVLFYTTKRVGGGVQNFDAIKLMKFGES
ncbi:phage major capsid protein [Hyphobacterium marinum]|uniref:Phage major capsid protein n=1 Tax=Hyphobacterium marinum TaxID=3116574 RepID=A0ABU7M1C5_9PROT|nr:phage major capsid protein [Hyphobacterium sp. Y6023]MEE2567332.1 phage major capsid protein [Hyphobacterium sp. Y6023]